jgi:hypothetical protein
LNQRLVTIANPFVSTTYVGGRQYKLVVNYPFWVSVQPTRLMQFDNLTKRDNVRLCNPFGPRINNTHLTILDGVIGTLPSFPVGNLHEESNGQGFSDIAPVVLVLESGRDQIKVILWI